MIHSLMMQKLVTQTAAKRKARWRRRKRSCQDIPVRAVVRAYQWSSPEEQAATGKSLVANREKRKSPG